MNSPLPPSGSTDRCKNEGGPARSPTKHSHEKLQTELEQYGITPVQLTVFDWGGNRYSNSKDAIAAAKRAAASS